MRSLDSVTGSTQVQIQVPERAPRSTGCTAPEIAEIAQPGQPRTAEGLVLLEAPKKLWVYHVSPGFFQRFWWFCHLKMVMFRWFSHDLTRKCWDVAPEKHDSNHNLSIEILRIMGISLAIIVEDVDRLVHFISISSDPGGPSGKRSAQVACPETFSTEVPICVSVTAAELPIDKLSIFKYGLWDTIDVMMRMYQLWVTKVPRDLLVAAAARSKFHQWSRVNGVHRVPRSAERTFHRGGPIRSIRSVAAGAGGSRSATAAGRNVCRLQTWSLSPRWPMQIFAWKRSCWSWDLCWLQKRSLFSWTL